jgi:hypothetical protein
MHVFVCKYVLGLTLSEYVAFDSRTNLEEEGAYVMSMQ